VLGGLRFGFSDLSRLEGTTWLTFAYSLYIGIHTLSRCQYSGDRKARYPHTVATVRPDYPSGSWPGLTRTRFCRHAEQAMATRRVFSAVTFKEDMAALHDMQWPELA